MLDLSTFFHSQIVEDSENDLHAKIELLTRDNRQKVSELEKVIASKEAEILSHQREITNLKDVTQVIPLT
jgi:hypothetical protein